MTKQEHRAGIALHRLLIFFCCLGAVFLALFVAGGIWALIHWPIATNHEPQDTGSSRSAAVTLAPATSGHPDVTSPDADPVSEELASPGVLVGTQISAGVASRQGYSAEKNLSELETMTRKLDAVSSDKSVDELADHFQHLMGLESRTAQATKAVAVNDFEINSAQLHDVRRFESKPGEFKYTAVLIDASGRTLDVELTAAEGPEVYELMQRIKASPLLERVYRRIAMPLLDSIVESAKNKAKNR